MELLFVRHARPLRVRNAEGQPDPELSEIGLAQTKVLVQALEAEHLDAVYTSPLRRARQTAQPLAQQRGFDSTVEPDLAELTFGESSYVPLDEIKDSPPDQDYLERWLQRLNTPETDATVRAFRSRVSAAVDRIVAVHSGQAVALVCHGGVINAVATAVLGLDEFLAFQPDFTSITRILASRTGHRSVRSVNEHSHLRAAGLLDPPVDTAAQ